MHKKSQAAMEFLMTYGWAILIVLVVTAALFFLGVFNPRTTNFCIATAPFTCTDVKFQASTNTLTLVLAAAGTYSSAPTIAVGGITANGVASTAGGGTISTITPTSMTWTAWTGGVNPLIVAGGKFSGTASVTYTPTNGVNHITTVQFSGTAE